MAPLSDDVDYDTGETIGNVPSQWCDAGNHEYHVRGHGTRYVLLGLHYAPTNLRNRRLTNDIKFYFFYVFDPRRFHKRLCRTALANLLSVFAPFVGVLAFNHIA
ncbi:unnamed protein product [Protopolystoma xenopodis]|uniref:Uncharacterized protein n=1 Tax=Protopolystoma xenopodis TaxID=117903 RepID=A0A448XDX8_9PLAT|nr:unnamed protein product [Protopolystoma xenopodis]